jgi:hypothetical protein
MSHAAVLAVLAVSACAVADDSTVESMTSEVNVGAAGQFTVATTALQGALRDAQRATGALFTPLSQFPNTRGSCGVTFVDRTHAITAGHCVNVTDVPDQQPLTVEFYDVDPELDWHATAVLSGTFPDYDHPRLRDAPGYAVTQTACRVVVRCRYGNLANGGSDWEFTRLCSDPATQQPGHASASYTALEYTRAIARLANP